MEMIDDSKMFEDYKLFMKFLKHPKELTEAEKRKLKDMGIKLWRIKMRDKKNQPSIPLESNQPIDLEEQFGSSFSTAYERRYRIKG